MNDMFMLNNTSNLCFSMICMTSPVFNNLGKSFRHGVHQLGDQITSVGFLDGVPYFLLQ